MAEVTIFYEGPVVSVGAARAQNLKRYFTGTPCKHGHLAERATASCRCVMCAKLDPSRKRWVKANPAKVKEYDRISRERNRDKTLERQREGMRKWRAAHPEESRRRAKEYVKKNREKVNARERKRHQDGLGWQRRFRASHPEEYRQHGLERYRREGAKMRERLRLGRRQRNEKIAGRPTPDFCEVCGSNKRISFDHCHQTGAFRGWLCGPCNSALGLVHDSPATLRKLARYLERSSGKPKARAAGPLLDLMDGPDAAAAPPAP